jgi:hypothetical protein
VPNFSRIISLAYVRILERLPDPGGLENYNRLMNEGLSEALMRESLLRSPEYAVKNPDLVRAAGRSASKAGKTARARKKSAARR